MWKPDSPQGSESMKMLWELVPFTRGFVLDLGCGPSKAFPHFVGVDNHRDKFLFGIQMNPDLTVPDASNLKMFADGAVDAVFSSHLLEHIVDFKAALREWWRVVKDGGHLCLYLPHKEFYPNIGQPGANPDHKHDFMPADIVEAMKEVAPAWDLLRNEDRNAGIEYSFFQVFRKGGEGHRFSHQAPKPAKRCAVVRYGAWGDALQMSSILPGLKAQGYHITLYSTPRAFEVISQDPHVDEVILQDTDQVPNHALGQFWDYERKKYDKWVNLSESVEALWLTLKERSQTNWPKSVRDKYLDTNYVQFAHELAEVPYEKPLHKFIPSLEERNWAHEQTKALKAKPFILWVLNGSSVHKVWPHLDQIFARVLLTYPEAKIVTVGDPEKSPILDEPWAKEPRVLRMAQKWSIRQTLAMAQKADLVVGPETGVLTGVACEPLPKIVFLSHSSVNNLTRDWDNTYALFSTKTPCYPCHKMIYGWDNCVRNEEPDKYWQGTAQCQVDLPPEACWMALTRALQPLVDKKKIPVADLDKLVQKPVVQSAPIPFVKKPELLIHGASSSQPSPA